MGLLELEEEDRWVLINQEFNELLEFHASGGSGVLGGLFDWEADVQEYNVSALGGGGENLSLLFMDGGCVIGIDLDDGV